MLHPSSGKCPIIEYKPDIDVRETEQIPLLEPGGIAGFIEREVWLWSRKPKGC